MNTIILSDTAILGSNYQSTKEGIYCLKLLQDKGYKLVVLSNRPELCMRKIGAFVSNDEKISYRYLGSCVIKGNGIDIIFHDDKRIIEEINIKYDYTIFGNGICTFNNQDKLIYQGKFITREILNEMIKIFRENGYKSYGELLTISKDSYGDRCFSGREDVYKFFTPTIGTTILSDNIYGMQCSSRSDTENTDIINKIDNRIPNIVGYVLNSKPCFYQKDINKLTALHHLANNYDINIDESIILLSEVTDDVINSKYKASNLSAEDNSSVKYESINHVLKNNIVASYKLMLLLIKIFVSFNQCIK